MATKYRVIARFQRFGATPAEDEYVNPGEPCPELDPETAKRLLAAGCIDDGTGPPPAPARRRRVSTPPVPPGFAERYGPPPKAPSAKK